MTTSTLDLTPYLESIGLRINRVLGVEVQAWCPAHMERTGSEDHKPSFYFNQSKLSGHCYSCDWKVPTLAALASYLGAPVDSDVITEASVSSLGEAVRKLGQAKKQILAETERQRYMEWRFSTMVPVPARLLELRRLSKDMAAYFDVRFDPKNNCWAIPIHSPRGKLLGWQRRQKGVPPNNYPAGIVKSETLFGLHLFDERRLVLVESPLDAVRLLQVGVAAVSSYGAAVSNKQVELLARNCAHVVLALDNDPTGLGAMPRLAHQLRRRIGVSFWDYSNLRKGKDPGDYESDEELSEAWRRTLRFGI